MEGLSGDGAVAIDEGEASSVSWGWVIVAN